MSPWEKQVAEAAISVGSVPTHPQLEFDICAKTGMEAMEVKSILNRLVEEGYILKHTAPPPRHMDWQLMPWRRSLAGHWLNFGARPRLPNLRKMIAMRPSKRLISISLDTSASQTDGPGKSTPAHHGLVQECGPQNVELKYEDVQERSGCHHELPAAQTQQVVFPHADAVPLIKFSSRLNGAAESGVFRYQMSHIRLKEIAPLPFQVAIWCAE